MFFFLYANGRAIMKIHPSFRVVALAEPPVIGSSSQQWLNPELLTLFMYHHIKPLTMAEEMFVIQGMVSLMMMVMIMVMVMIAVIMMVVMRC